MSSPKLAHETDRGRYYKDPRDGELYMSVTNALDTVNKPALAPSAAKITAEKAWTVLPRMVALSRKPVCDRSRVAAACGRCRDCLTREIKAEYKNLWETKRDFGTVVHDYAEAKVTGKPMPPNPDVEPYIGQYIKWAERFGVDFDRDIEFTELTVFHRTHRYAGTADLGVHLHLSPDLTVTPEKRWLWLVDFKSSISKPADVVYREQPLQLAALRYPEVLMGPDDTEHPVPEYAGAAVLNLREKSHGFIPLPAGPDVHAAFLHCLQLAYFLHDQDLKATKPLEVHPVTSLKRGAA